MITSIVFYGLLLWFKVESEYEPLMWERIVLTYFEVAGGAVVQRCRKTGAYPGHSEGAFIS